MKNIIFLMFAGIIINSACVHASEQKDITLGKKLVSMLRQNATQDEYPDSIVVQVQALIKQGASVNEVDEEDNTALWYASCNGHLDVVDVLITAGSNVRYEKNGVTVLHIAAQNGQAPVADRLIQAGADTNACEHRGATPLFIAAWLSRVETVRVLLSHGAMIDKAEKNGITPLAIASVSEVEEKAEEVVNELVHNGADLNLCDNRGYTPLLATLSLGAGVLFNSGARVRIAKKLIQAGANTYATNNRGETSLGHAVLHGNSELVRLILDAGADVDACDSEGSFPICSAVKSGNKEIVEMLADAGADLTGMYYYFPWEEPISLLWYALFDGHLDIAHMLHAKGAPAIVPVGWEGELARRGDTYIEKARVLCEKTTPLCEVIEEKDADCNQCLIL